VTEKAVAVDSVLHLMLALLVMAWLLQRHNGDGPDGHA